MQKWYSPLKNNAEMVVNTPQINAKMMNGRGLIKEHFKNNLTIEKSSTEYQIISENKILSNISKVDNKYFYFDEVGQRVVVLDVSPNIEGQKNLIYTTLYLLILFGIMSYFLSLYFVKSSLGKLNNLVEHVKYLEVDNLQNKIEIEGPENDEINILAMRMNEAMDKIHKQTLALKDFISNASHELKTPLMTMNSEIDYAIKSKKHKEGLGNLKLELKSMNNLLDELVLITKLDGQIKFDKKEKNLSDIVLKNLKNISNNYGNKNIKIIKKIESINKFVHNSSFDIIAKNLIENAFKYTEKGEIEIILNNNEFVVKDSGIGIEKNNLDKIWERFWQEDGSKTDTKSFGLGLYLTKLLVEKHGWKIEVESKKGKGSEFRIVF
ncbi:MAG TPA: HAMP domain-containing sensor histidine kinase [Candidatus Absconditabacterales bacterium]|nr:HAMP domain-containing sensor histidine kinase [Candidatus Absconditabacterales bacterium]